MSAPVISWINAVHVDARVRQSAPFKAPRILIARATDVRVAVTVRDSDNSRSDLSGAQLVLTACGDRDLSTVLFAVPADLVDDDGAALPDGEASFLITADDTSAAAIGRAYYSIDVTWPDGRREQLIPPTEAWIVATPPRVPLGGSARALAMGVLVFDGEDSLPIAFDAGLPSEDYRVLFTPGASDDGDGAPFCTAEDATKSGCTAKLSGPFHGPVAWVVLPSASRAVPASMKALAVGAVKFTGETEREAVFSAPIGVAYRVVLSQVRSGDDSPPAASAIALEDTRFRIRTSGPLTGSVGYAIYAQ